IVRQGPSERRGPAADDGRFDQVAARTWTTETIEQPVIKSRHVTAQRQHGVMSGLGSVVKRSAEATERDQSRRRTVAQMGQRQGTVAAAADNHLVAMPREDGRGMDDQRLSLPDRERLVAAKAARLSAGEDRGKARHASRAIAKDRASPRKVVCPVLP